MPDNGVEPNQWLVDCKIVCVCVVFLLAPAPLLGSIDLAWKDNRQLDSQPQQLAWFTHELRLILTSPRSRGRIAFSDWLLGPGNHRITMHGCEAFLVCVFLVFHTAEQNLLLKILTRRKKGFSSFRSCWLQWNVCSQCLGDLTLLMRCSEHSLDYWGWPTVNRFHKNIYFPSAQSPLCIEMDWEMASWLRRGEGACSISLRQCLFADLILWSWADFSKGQAQQKQR